MKKIKRVNLFAGPGGGKSTSAAFLFSRLKMENKKVELIQEYVKEWAYEGRQIPSFDQLFVFANQLRREELTLRHGMDLIITDSPLQMSVCYARKYNFIECGSLTNIAKSFEKLYPSINIYLERSSEEYETEGRYETYEQAVELDGIIMSYLKEQEVDFVSIDHRDNEKLLDIVKKVI